MPKTGPGGLNLGYTRTKEVKPRNRQDRARAACERQHAGRHAASCRPPRPTRCRSRSAEASSAERRGAERRSHVDAGLAHAARAAGGLAVRVDDGEVEEARPSPAERERHERAERRTRRPASLAMQREPDRPGREQHHDDREAVVAPAVGARAERRRAWRGSARCQRPRAGRRCPPRSPRPPRTRPGRRPSALGPAVPSAAPTAVSSSARDGRRDAGPARHVHDPRRAAAPARPRAAPARTAPTSTRQPERQRQHRQREPADQDRRRDRRTA